MTRPRSIRARTSRRRHPGEPPPSPALGGQCAQNLPRCRSPAFPSAEDGSNAQPNADRYLCRPIMESVPKLEICCFDTCVQENRSKTSPEPRDMTHDDACMAHSTCSARKAACGLFREISRPHSRRRASGRHDSRSRLPRASHLFLQHGQGSRRVLRRLRCVRPRRRDASRRPRRVRSQFACYAARSRPASAR